MLSLEDVNDILAIPLLGVIPESPSVLTSSNVGVPVIRDETADAGQAYQDLVARFLGEDKPHRFLAEQKKSFFGKLFGAQ
jgi:septum site-determining protein MinD